MPPSGGHCNISRPHPAYAVFPHRGKNQIRPDAHVVVLFRGDHMSDLKAIEYRSFESIKHVSHDGNEYWCARELAPVLEYVQWRNFAKVLDRGILACRNSGYPVGDHFVEVSKTIRMPKTASKQVVDFQLTRYACYRKTEKGHSLNS